MDLYELSAPVRDLRKRLRAGRPTCWPRVDRVCPVAGRRTVAITFDDGPTALRTVRGELVTEAILRVLGHFGMRATFNVIGSTAANYPDRPGPTHTPLWNGVRFDHYPAYGLDQWAGVANQPLLARRLVEEGHELGNHSFRHLAFGPERIVYGRRAYHPDAAAVRADCLRMQDLCHHHLGVRPVVARPPHYVSRTADRVEVLELYRELGLTLAGASFDLGAWRATRGSLRVSMAAAVRPLRELLARDGDALDGRILFGKDGLNMSLEPAVTEVLPEQLRILHDHGYRVVPVSELLRLGRFADLAPDDPLGAQVYELLRLGLPCAFSDNTVRPGQPVAPHELDAVRRAAARLLPGEGVPEPRGTGRRQWLSALHRMVSAATAISAAQSFTGERGGPCGDPQMNCDNHDSPFTARRGSA